MSVTGSSLWKDFGFCARLLTPALRGNWRLAGALAVAGAALEAAAAVAVWQLFAQLGGVAGSVSAMPREIAAWIALGLVLAKNGVRLAELVVRERTVEATAAALSQKIFRAWLRAPWSEHLRALPGRPAFESGELAAATMREVFFSVATAAAEGLVFVGFIAVLVAVAPGALTLAIALGALVVGIALAATHRWQARWGTRLHEIAAEHAGFLEQSFAGAKELFAFGRISAWTEAQAQRRGALARVTAQRVIFDQWPPVLVDTFFIGGVVVAAMVFGGGGARGGGLPLIAFIAYAGFRLLPTLNRLIVRSQVLRSSRSAFAVLTERLRAGEASDASPETTKTESRELAFERVSFVYPGGSEPCLRDVTVRVAPGESVAIMGPTGGGKTTLLHLALGLLEPTSGAVTSGAGRAGYVAQDGWVFEHTLAANVALVWSPAEIDAARLEAALHAAQLTGWIATLPEGVNTYAGPGGLRLSGGQRQRLCLARALYARPEILFLDEATAALDPHTEAALLAALRAWRPHATQLWVTHRESVARACDRVWFVADGRVAAEGTFEDLLARDAAFRQFVAHAAGSAAPA